MASWEDFKRRATEVARSYGFPPSVLLGQAALETGRSPQNAPGNNWFGIKGRGTAGSNRLATKEQGMSGLFSTSGNFAAYASVDDAIAAYINLIKNNYPQAWAVRHDPVAMIHAIKAGGYATDNNYVAKVMNTPEFKEFSKGQVAGISTFEQPTSNPINPLQEQIRRSLAEDQKRTGIPIINSQTGEVIGFKEPKNVNKNNKRDLFKDVINSFNPFRDVQGAETNMRAVGGMKVPTPTALYTVRPGDTLWGVAERTLGSGNRWQEIQGYKGSPSQLPVGTRLSVPNARVSNFTPTASNMRPVTPSKPTGPVAKGPAVPYKAPSARPTPQPTPRPAMKSPVKTSKVTQAIQNAIGTVKSWFN